jgi:uncharacterized glyoxalase superfamily protein PhnB
MHCTIAVGGASIAASDGCNDAVRFDGFRLSLVLASEADARRAFAGLSEGGTIQLPISKTFWSPCFGMVTDRFGVGWMVTSRAVQKGQKRRLGGRDLYHMRVESRRDRGRARNFDR